MQFAQLGGVHTCVHFNVLIDLLVALLLCTSFIVDIFVHYILLIERRVVPIPSRVVAVDWEYMSSSDHLSSLQIRSNFEIDSNNQRDYNDNSTLFNLTNYAQVPPKTKCLSQL